MNTTIDVYLGGPLEIDSEKAFLARLKADLGARGESGLILGNFFPPRKPHQIDFLVATRRCACHIELKGLTAAVQGGLNGRWQLRLPDGSLTPLEAKNPYRQALDGKLAISDELHAFARRDPSIPGLPPGEKFYKHLDSVVCVYPELLPGSSVPSDYKVRALGYADLLDLLTTRSKNPPGWTRATWTAFAMHLALVRDDEAGESLPPDLRAAQEAIAAYRDRCGRDHRRDLQELVPTTLRTNEREVSLNDLEDWVHAGRHLQIVGPSGCGKSLLVRHLALRSLDRGRIPILLQARDYDGRLSGLLDRGIAHLHPDTAADLLRAADRCGASTVVMLDGFNECPAGRRDALMRDLQTFFLRRRIPMVIATQEPVAVTEELRGLVVAHASLTDEQRRRIIGAHHHGPVPDGFAALCAPFESAYELSLAAACAADDGRSTTRAGLFDSYVTRRCEQAEDATLVREVLGGLAEQMQDLLVSSLPISEARRTAVRILKRAGGPLRLFQAALGCGLLESRQGRCTFRHEMLERFFQAEALVQAQPSPDALALALSSPRNRPLAEFAVAMQGDAATVRRLLEAMADPELLGDCLRGRLGRTAEEAARAECHGLLRRAARALEQVEVRLVGDPPLKMLEILGGPAWTAYDCAILRAVGEALGRSEFLNEVVRLARLTDEAYHRQLASSPGPEGCLKVSDAASAFYGVYVVSGRPDSRFLPVSNIYHALRLSWVDGGSDRSAELARASTIDLGSRTPGELAFLCQVLRHPRTELAESVLPLLETCCATRIYNLRLVALDMVGYWSRALDGERREELITYLRSILSNQPILNSAVFDALECFGAVEPSVSADDVRSWIETVLQSPADPQAQREAYRIVASIIDSFDTEAFHEAITGLPREAQARLFTMAAFADDGGFINDWIVTELVKLDSEVAIPAFRRWAAPPGRTSRGHQAATTCFLAAVAGCARHLNTPAPVDAIDSSDRQAWAVYGEILFWLAHPGTTPEKRRSLCAPLWQRLRTELAFEAVDPLFRFEGASWAGSARGADTLRLLGDAFRDELRSILEFGLRHRERLTTAFDDLRGDELLRFLVRWLGTVGDRETVRLLEGWCNSPEVGLIAIEAVRRLKANDGAP
jgi:hypothetical protein